MQRCTNKWSPSWYIWWSLRLVFTSLGSSPILRQNCISQVISAEMQTWSNCYARCPAEWLSIHKAVVITEIKLKENRRKTMFCFSEIVLFQCRFSVFTCGTKCWNKKVGVAYLSIKKLLKEVWSCYNIYVIYDVTWQHGGQRCVWGMGGGCSVWNRHGCTCRYCHC